MLLNHDILAIFLLFEERPLRMQILEDLRVRFPRPYRTLPSPPLRARSHGDGYIALLRAGLRVIEQRVVHNLSSFLYHLHN